MDDLTTQLRRIARNDIRRATHETLHFVQMKVPGGRVDLERTRRGIYRLTRLPYIDPTLGRTLEAALVPEEILVEGAPAKVAEVLWPLFEVVEGQPSTA